MRPIRLSAGVLSVAATVEPAAAEPIERAVSAEGRRLTAFDAISDEDVVLKDCALGAFAEVGLGARAGSMRGIRHAIKVLRSCAH